jgi:hypothetical protein
MRKEAILIPYNYFLDYLIQQDTLPYLRQGICFVIGANKV